MQAIGSTPALWAVEVLTSDLTTATVEVVAWNSVGAGVEAVKAVVGGGVALSWRLLREGVQAAIDEAEAEQWEEEQAQVRWAEAGGYAAGLARPAALWERRARAYADDGSNDIPF